MSELDSLERLSVKPFEPIVFKTTGDFYIALSPDTDNVFDTENSLYRCRPGFTITPNTELGEEDQAKIASAVTIVGVDETSVVRTWASGSLKISFTQDIPQNTEFTLSISDLPEIEGKNFITFQPFVFKTIGTLELTVTPDADNVYAAVSPKYQCRPSFTITPGIALTEEDRTKIANALSVTNLDANQITKNWNEEGKLLVGFAQNLAPATEYTLSLLAVNDIKGVSVTPFEPLVFTTIGNLEITLTPDANNVYSAVDQKYRCNPGFTITSSFALNEVDRTKIANAVTIASAAEYLVKSWDGNNLRLSLNQNLATNTSYLLSMAAVNDIKGINVVPFNDLNFTTIGGLGFTVTPDDDNVYAAVSPKYQCRPGFTITPDFILNEEDRTRISEAVSLSDAASITLKIWDGNALKIYFTSDLATNTAYTLSMAEVNDIGGVPVIPFVPLEFTTLEALAFTVTPDDDNLFDVPNSLCHCKPGFTIAPNFALNDIDRTKILNAVSVSDVAVASITREWSNDGKLLVGFNTKLASGTDYSLNMAAVNDIKGVEVTPFDSLPFRTMNAINITIDSKDSNIIDVQNNLYHCRPQFTITPVYEADDSAREIIASAVTVIGADENNVTKTWLNGSLELGFANNLTTNTEYTVSIGDLEAEFDRLAFKCFEPLTFTTTGDSYIALVPDEENVFVSTPSELYHCRPTFTITPSVALGDNDRLTIANAIHVSNVADDNLTKNWDASGSLVLGFSQNLNHDTQYTVSIDAIGEISGVNLILFQPFTFRTVPALGFNLVSAAGNTFVTTPSELYHCRPTFTLMPSLALGTADRAKIAAAIRVTGVSDANITREWDNAGNLLIGFNQNLNINTDYTLSLAAVNDITGITVNAFIPLSFTTVGNLTIAMQSDNGNVFTTQNGVQLYKTMPTFTVTSNSNLNSTLKNRVAEAISVSDVDSSIISKVWTNDRTLKISFTDNIALNASYTISMAAINDITGVSVAGFNDFSFSTMKALTFTLTPSSTNAIVTSPTELYRNRPSFTISSNYTLTSAIKTKIEEAVTVSDADGVTKSWNNGKLQISFSSDLASNSTHIISMNAVNDITGVIVAPFESFNFTIVDCLTFTVAPEEGSVYEAMSPKCIRKPVFIITPNYILSQYNKNTISNAVRVSNASGVTKTWDGNNLRVTFSSNLTSNSTHTLSMNAVSIYGLPVVPFNNFDFTILEALTFTITPDPEGVYEAMSPKCRNRPAFTVSPSYAVNNEDKAKIADAISVSNADNILEKNWNGNDLIVSFSGDLNPGRGYTISMSSVSGMDYVPINRFSNYNFTTLATLTFTLTPDSGNVFSGTKYHCRPDFTITPSFILNNEDKPGIANAVSVSGVDSSIVDKHWENNKLILGFTQNLATDTTYTISMAEINHINGVIATSLTSSDFTTIPELILSIATNTNSIVKKSGSNPDDLDVNGEKYFYCKPELVISPSFTISSETSRLIIANAVAASGNASALLTTNWNYGKLVVGFSDNLDASSTYSISMSDLNNLKGVTVKVFPQFDFNTFFYQGKGTSADPFTIYTPKQFASLDYYIPQYYYYKQMEDIDLSAYANWKPLASSTDKLEFHGYYNGNNKKISNAVIDYPDDDYVGLFAKTYGAIFNDLILENINVTGKTYVGGLTGYRKQGTEWKNIRFYDITASGTSYVGSLAGYLYGSQFSDIEFSNVHVYGGGNIGGFSGYNDGGTFKNISFSNVTASGTNHIGGLSGHVSYGSYSDISCNNVEVTGNNFVGGVFGDFPITIRNCTITNSRITSSGRCSGGFAGSCCYRAEAKLRNVNCDNITLIGSGEMGGCVGSIECSLEECSVTNSHIECLTSTNYTKVCGGLIGSTAQGYQGEYTISNCFVSNTEIISNFSGVGGIAGSLRSQKTMDNCFVKDSTISGLSGVGGFLAGDGGGLIQNCYVENTKVSATGNTNSVGGFLGSSSSSKVESCHVASMSIETACGIVGGFIGKCESEIESSYASKVKIKLLGSNNVSDFGGLIGYSYGEPITTCYVDQATIEGKKSVGGLIGRRSSSDAVNKCFVRNSEVKSFGDSKTGGLIGDLATSTLDSCYITGCSIVTDVDVPSVAGLVGSNTGDISNCYMYDSTLTGKADYGAIAGTSGSGAREPAISDCFVSQDHDTLINTNYKNDPVNSYYNVNDLATFNGKTWSDGAWSSYDTTSFPPQLTDLPEP